MKNEMIDGMEPARFLAAQLLTNSSLTGKRYYDKEDEYTNILKTNLPLLENTNSPKLTEKERYHALFCVKYIGMELNDRLLKAEIKYESCTHYDAELDQKIAQLKESIAFHDALINKLEKIL